MQEQIVRIKKQDAPIFEGLDPFDRLSMLDMPNSFALASISVDDMGERYPSGLMVASADKKKLSINWLGVANHSQGRGVGGRLLDKAYDIAKSGEMDIVEAVLSAEFLKEAFFTSAGGYFECHMFDEVYPIPTEYMGQLRELLSLPYFKQDLKKLPKPVQLSALTIGGENSALKQLDELKLASKLYSVSGQNKRLEEDVSYIFFEEGEAFGALLVQRIEDCLIPVYYYAESDNEGSALIVSAAGMANMKYGKDEDVQIFLRTDDLRSLMEQIFPDKKDGGKRLVGKVEEYHKAVRRNKEK